MKWSAPRKTPLHMLLMVLLCWGVAPVGQARTTEANPVFYRLEHLGQTLYLLGSIHVGQASFYPMHRLIESAFAGADTLVVEVDIRQPISAQQLIKYGKVTPPAQLPATTQALLAQYCQPRQAFCQSLKPWAPWLQSLQIGMMRYQTLGYQAQFGVDLYWLNQAADKRVLALETSDFQLGLLASFTDPTQDYLMIQAISASDADMLALVDAWYEGDDEQLVELSQTQVLAYQQQSLVERLLWQRNHTMAQGLLEIMSQHQGQAPIFAVIGAAHVVGPKSVVSILVERGGRLIDCRLEPKRCGS
ncbi:TraB/GumN family protein [Shewanella sp. NIFS-20-20]|uniref:TraB/GumN family protein n=1 Tax=Shewanella sp. NIFS-20-20 TaxID=2853806 RepID=UPI001C4405BC|nr:TraB/GumN family protein [Shewanella sp. NIFS-20-20]MBV7316188.1 TraB/GumN family protein [Shewanella sp. NIFS-20-20]